MSLVQPIVVTRSGTHEQAVCAAAFVAVHAWIRTHTLPVWDKWLAGSLRRIVRYVDPSAQDRVAEHAVTSTTVGGTTAYSFAPESGAEECMEILDRDVKFDRNGLWTRRGVPGIGPAVLLDPNAAMDTSTAVDAAATALFRWATELDEFDLLTWIDAEFPFTVQEPARFSDFPSVHTSADDDGRVVAKAMSTRTTKWWL